MDQRYAMTELPGWLKAHSRTVRFARGQFIFHQNDPVGRIYVVARGPVIILSIDEKGQERKVVLVPEGGTVGEMEAMVGTERAVYSAKAFTDCELVALSASEFMRWIDEDARALKQLAFALSHKLHAASSQSAQYMSLGATERLASVLAALGPGAVRHTRLELAEACSTSVRTVNRSIVRLEAAGALTRAKGKLALSARQIEALRTYAMKQ
ncbi:MAG: Crp/Fnr family transcriptional regulator [Eubacteriales bacterium]|nr:Crp/Fnr family transcriptional regulator [Eubacteriales bacterium]